jgi:DNA-binding transcriptional LysR family regulator
VKTVNLRQLQYFVVLAQELHFGRAAERLGMTQPPLSQQIQALEDYLGARLFVRNKRSVQLSPIGTHWLPEVKRVLEEVAELPALAKRLAAGENGTLSLAFVSTADYNLLPRVLHDYSRKHPDVKVQLLEATSDIQIEALLERRIDAGIIIPPITPLHPDLQYLRLLEEPLIAAVPQQWQDSGKVTPGQRQIDIASLANEPLICFPHSSAPALRDVIFQYFAAHSLSPRQGQQAIQMQTIVSLVSAGMGIALVPASLRNLQRTGVLYLELQGEVPRLETGLLWNRHHVQPTLQRLIEAVTVIAPQEP